MTYLANGAVKVGLDLNRGGAIVFLARAGGNNLINNFDLGRQVQLSFFSGPVPFEAKGQRPKEHWKHIGWNPIQAGDDSNNPSRVLAHTNDGRTLYVKLRPMQWPLDNVPGDCTFESWLELEGAVVKGRARLNNARADRRQYTARLQELPAVYANAAFHRVVSYTGDRPFSGGALTAAPRPTGKHPWSFWLGTEGWSALLDQRDQGLGLITPGRVHFTGGFAGEPGPNDTFGNSTSYVAGQGQEILDHNITYEFRYELVVGSLKEIRARAASRRPKEPPAWTFAKDRQGWHYQNASDLGWPIQGHVHLRLDQNDPQLISPYTFVRAEDAPILVIEAAFKTKHRDATVYWERHGQSAPAETDVLTFPINPDEQFHRYTVDLSAATGYRGGITRLRFDPVPAGTRDDWVKVRSIGFGKAVP
ncbi:MAG: hypothetical protein OER86_03315 [Phycisphaerae bacterium]|nr:hypothetical protein [Phycisphaerae bacterium]